MGERTEAILRIIIGIISGFILGIWKIVIEVVVVIHWIYVMFTGKRSKEMANFSNRWVTFVYRYIRYITFVSNKRPFPFNSLGKDIEKVEMKWKFFR